MISLKYEIDNNFRYYSFISSNGTLFALLQKFQSITSPHIVFFFTEPGKNQARLHFCLLISVHHMFTENLNDIVNCASSVLPLSRQFVPLKTRIFMKRHRRSSPSPAAELANKKRRMKRSYILGIKVTNCMKRFLLLFTFKLSEV